MSRFEDLPEAGKDAILKFERALAQRQARLDYQEEQNRHRAEVERIARLLCEADRHIPDFTPLDSDQPFWRQYEDAARAAIREMPRREKRSHVQKAFSSLSQDDLDALGITAEDIRS